MTPHEFAASYHNVNISDPRAGLAFSANLWMYVSGSTGGKEIRTAEYNDMVGRIAKALGVGKVPDIFYITNNSLIDPYEPFYKQGLRRAYAGRGSTEEVRDAVRLAWALKKCGNITAKQYAEGWFGQDCNAFVGNYLGVSPNISIRAYARGYDAEPGDHMDGATNDVYLCMSLVPLPLITDPTKVKTGDVIITYSSKFKHVALVSDYILNQQTMKADIAIAEWGHKGKDVAEHAVPSKSYKIEVGATCGGMPGQKLVGFKDGSNFRFFLDASPYNDFPSRGWAVAGKEGY